MKHKYFHFYNYPNFAIDFITYHTGGKVVLAVSDSAVPNGTKLA